MEIREFSPRDAESSEDTAEMLFSRRRCCFRMPCFRSSNRSSASVGPNWWQRMTTAGERDDGSLWSRGIGALKKLREWSEIVAGPRWKTFIRRFNRSKSGGNRSSKYHYDALSYALNFDAGPGHSDDTDDHDGDDDFRYRNFSSRYASIPASSKTSMDVGKTGPSFV